jgi:hypothetical protein
MSVRPKDLSALQLMEAYVFLVTVEIQNRIRGNAPYQGHFGKFSRWIDAQVEQGSASENRLVPDGFDLVALESEDRQARIHQLQGELQGGEFAAVAELVTRLLDNCVGVFNGETEILDVFVRDNGLTKLYNLTGERTEPTEFFVTAGHTNPMMRILEIGAGTGGTTLVALQALTSINGEPMYGNYTYVPAHPVLLHLLTKVYIALRTSHPDSSLPQKSGSRSIPGWNSKSWISSGTQFRKALTPAATTSSSHQMSSTPLKV